jgi:hypothetical protein
MEDCLESVAPPGATAVERMVLMQQERIEQIEGDFCQLTRSIDVLMPLAPVAALLPLEDGARICTEGNEWDAFFEYVESGVTRANIVYRHASMAGAPVYEFRRGTLASSSWRTVGGWLTSTLRGGHPPFLIGIPDGTAPIRRAFPELRAAASDLTHPICINDEPDRSRFEGERGWYVAGLAVVDSTD